MKTHGDYANVSGMYFPTFSALFFRNPFHVASFWPADVPPDNQERHT